MDFTRKQEKKRKNLRLNIYFNRVCMAFLRMPSVSMVQHRKLPVSPPSPEYVNLSNEEILYFPFDCNNDL